MICKYCGCELKDTAKFCNGCGNPTGVIRTEIFETGFYEAEDTGYESAPVHVTFSPETVSFSPEAVTYAPETVTFSPEPSTLELTNTDEPKTLDLASADTFIAIPHPKVTEPAYETEPVDLGPVGELRRILAKNPYSKSSLAYISNYAIPDNYNELYEYMALIASKIDRHEINREEMDREVILSRILFA